MSPFRAVDSSMHYRPAHVTYKNNRYGRRACQGRGNRGNGVCLPLRITGEMACWRLSLDNRRKAGRVLSGGGLLCALTGWLFRTDRMNGATEAAGKAAPAVGRNLPARGFSESVNFEGIELRRACRHAPATGTAALAINQWGRGVRSGGIDHKPSSSCFQVQRFTFGPA